MAPAPLLPPGHTTVTSLPLSTSSLPVPSSESTAMFFRLLVCFLQSLIASPPRMPLPFISAPVLLLLVVLKKYDLFIAPFIQKLSRKLRQNKKN
jgi:hypothetical protein